MSFGSSSSVYPTASSAASFAIGKPVAFEASAEERETRGFISITRSSCVSGWTANWTFAPPVATPTARAVANAASRRRWYAASGSVCCGAIVHESPVWTPIGSRFSIEHTTTALPRASHITSSSCSCQPARYSSTSTCPTGLAARPCATTARSSLRRVRDAAAGAAERERRPDDRRRRELDVGVGRDHAVRHGQADRLDRRAEELAVLGAPDRAEVGADQLDAERRELDREVERGLPAERRQDRVGPLARDHLGDRLRRRAARGTSRRPTRGRS